MNTKFQIQITVHNWDGGTSTISKDFYLRDISRFTALIGAINNNSGKNTFNWFGNGKGLPVKFNGANYTLDKYTLIKIMNDNFGLKINSDDDINLVKEFFLRFTPYGADHILNIKIFKIEELELQ